MFQSQDSTYLQNYCDSLQKLFWDILICCDNPEQLSDNITFDHSLQQDSKIKHISPELSLWIQYLILMSNTFRLTGFGSTVYLPNEKYEKWAVGVIETLSKDYAPYYPIQTFENELSVAKKGIPVNYTQSLAAATWYDVNRHLTNPCIFYLFCGANAGWIFSENNSKINTNENCDSTIPERIRHRFKEDYWSMATIGDSLYIDCMEKVYDIRQVFHLWPDSTTEISIYLRTKFPQKFFRAFFYYDETSKPLRFTKIPDGIWLPIIHDK